MKNENNWPNKKNQYFAPITRNANPNVSTAPQKFPGAYHTVRPAPRHKTTHTKGLHGIISQDETPKAIQEQQNEGSQTQFLVTTERHEKKMGPSKPDQRTTKTVHSSQTSSKAHSGAERQIRVILRNERFQQHFLAKREAVIDVQTKFFCALRRLHTWPLEKLTYADPDELRDHWYQQLEVARKCAYRAESIDPNYSGPIRYDTMCEIVTLENQRINDFLTDFEHYRELILRSNNEDMTDNDEGYCDQTMLAYLKPRQVDVALSRPPQWIEQAKRPPLTWYGFLAPDQTPTFSTSSMMNERILAPEYYD
jgi:hypothetical protein